MVSVSKSLAEKASSQVSVTRKMGIVEFVESPSGLNERMLPAQRALLKVMMKEDLDDEVCDIEIRDRFNKRTLFYLSEVGFYQYLVDNNKVSLPYDVYRGLDTYQYIFNMGRRASKSTMVMWITAYALYEILLEDDPQLYFGIVSTDTINIKIIALGEDNAQSIFARLKRSLTASPFFRPHILTDNTSTELKLWSNRDLRFLRSRGRIGNPEPNSNSITVSASPTTSAVRGANTCVAVLEEFAHFPQPLKTPDDQSTAGMIYAALVPSVVGFKRPDGTTFGRVYVLSSANGKRGLFYKQYQDSFTLGVKSGSLAVSARTVDVNPTVSSVFLESQYNRNPVLFRQEFESEFVEGLSSWITDLGCLYRSFSNLRRVSLDHGRLDRQYFLGADFAFQNDATAFAVSHFERGVRRDMEDLVEEAKAYNDVKFLDEFVSVVKDRYVVDLIERHQCGVPPYEGYKVLPVDGVIGRLVEIYERFPIVCGMTDQYSGAVILQLCEARGLKRFDVVTHTQAINSEQYQNFAQLLHTDGLVMPWMPYLAQQLLSLQCESRSNGLISVENASDHDDMFDALIRSLYLAVLHLTKNEKVLSSLGMKMSLRGGQERNRISRGYWDRRRDSSFKRAFNYHNNQMKH